MSNTDGLEPDRRDDMPVGPVLDLVGEPSGVGEISPESFGDGIWAIDPQLVPELERSEPSTERNAPVSVLGRLSPLRLTADSWGWSTRPGSDVQGRR